MGSKHPNGEKWQTKVNKNSHEQNHIRELDEKVEKNQKQILNFFIAELFK